MLKQLIYFLHNLVMPSLLSKLLKILKPLNSKKHIAFVALHENKIVGWIGAAQTIMIEVIPHCEINRLITDERYRGKGVGKLLIEKVKQWARENGNKVLSLHCNLTRTKAHLFYEHIGFKVIKEQKYFTIDI